MRGWRDGRIVINGYVLVGDVEYPTRTQEEIETAKAAMRAAGLKSALVFHADGVDDVRTGWQLNASEAS